MNTKQMQCEVDAWVRMLAFIKEENIHLKNRLSGVIQIRLDKDFLNEAEIFQDSFINNDTIIALLKNDICTHERQLAKVSNKDKSQLGKVFFDQKELREDMEKLEKEFSKLKVEFNNYIDEISNTYQAA